MKPGRPRNADSRAVRQVLIDLVREGVRTFTVPLLVSTLSFCLPISRATAYRALRLAHEEGTIRIPPFEHRESFETQDLGCGRMESHEVGKSG